jgi:hypothetical protein
VDIVLQNNDQHSYERMFPFFKDVVLAPNFTNPQAPIQIVLGTASPTHVSPTLPPPTEATASTPVEESESNKTNSGGASNGSNSNGTVTTAASATTSGGSVKDGTPKHKRSNDTTPKTDAIGRFRL